MCGIVGKYSATRPADPDLISEMCGLVSHRGPDDEGRLVEGGLGLGHRRLSVLDLSSAGHQPMATPDKRFWITYNGEIYNFWDIRRELEREGHVFGTRTDTEVLLAAYRKWGPACLDRLNGMFAFAIWDRRERTLFLARDRLGIKPLYYAFDGKSLLFGSEIKAMLADPGLRRDLSPRGMRNFFTFGHSVAPDTIFESVRKLRPGHYMTCRPASHGRLSLSIQQYWTTPKPQTEGDRGERHYAEQVQELLKRSVSRRMLADVPVGVFLSGGIDSSTITALMTAATDTPVETFSVGFAAAERDYTELDDARRIARLFNTNHHELIAEPSHIVNAVENVIYQYDEPFADAASLPTYLLSQMAREHVTVVLSGEGADEVFGGYRRYVAEKYLARTPWLPAIASNALVRSALRTGVGSSRAKRLLRGVGIRDRVARYGGWFEVFTPDLQADLLSDAWAKRVSGLDSMAVYRSLYPSNGMSTVDRLLFMDQQTWLPDTYLEKVDKATMAHALEARVPFLDHELVEFAATIPAKYKVKGRRTKHILKQAMAGVLPAETIQKPKHGFSVPYPAWFRAGLREMVSDTLLSSRARERGILDAGAVAALIDRHQQGQETHYRQLWLVFVFELWCHRFLDKTASIGAGPEQTPAAVQPGSG